ncbi:hypothetical protein ACIQI8_42100 [Streptomyces sp. NPDC092369]|uniref:TetR/AcrR family transcriptional regulator n=1 Tax=Streptomyces sp. NPDC092369 TaxID=3366015 RepID=UPI0037F87413
MGVEGQAGFGEAAVDEFRVVLDALCVSTVQELALTRFVQRLPASTALGREEVVDSIGPTVQRYLTAPAP